MIFSLQVVVVNGGWQSLEIVHSREFLFTDCSPLLIGALDGSIQSVTIPDTVNIQLSS
jgi:hypothetical protein